MFTAYGSRVYRERDTVLSGTWPAVLHQHRCDKQTEDEGSNFGVDGEKGTIADMRKLGVWEPYCVKAQTLKTAIESSCLILRIDDVVSGTRRRPMQE